MNGLSVKNRLIAFSIKVAQVELELKQSGTHIIEFNLNKQLAHVHDEGLKFF